MRLTVFIALVAGVSASTPSGFQPSNDDDLLITFGSGNSLQDATHGRNIARADTSQPPTIYTDSQLSGRYALMIVDADANYLHFLQELTSDHHSTTVDSKTVYQLSNSSGPIPIAAYAQPNPPNKDPYTHRYVALLLNVTSIQGIGDESLRAMAQTRTNFNVVNVVKTAAVPIIGSNWFNVTNEAALAAGSASVSSGSGASSTTSGSQSSTSAPATTTMQSSATSASAAATSSTKSANAAVGMTGDAAIGGVIGAVVMALGML